MIERARAMLPALRARGEAADAARDLPEATIREFQEAGFFRIVQPRIWGGYEMNPAVLYDVQAVLGEACMSSSWIAGVVGGHAYLMSLFDERAQEEVWGQNDSTLIASSFMPVGKVEAVAGGYRLSGQWQFSSGSRHCQWFFLGGFIPPEDEGGRPDLVTFLVPREDIEILDTWHVFGLKATGSHDVRAQDVFVPDYRIHRAADGFNCTNPGQALNRGPLYRLPWAQTFRRLVSSPALGAARGALQAFVDIAQTRVSKMTGGKTKEDVLALNIAARLHSEVDEMQATLHRNFDLMLAKADAQTPLTLEERLRYAYQSSSVVTRCASLVDGLLPLLGGRAIYTDSPILRFWMDLNAARAHTGNNPTLVGPDLMGNQLGQEPAPGFY